MQWKNFKAELLFVAASIFLVVIFIITLFYTAQNNRYNTTKSKAIEPEPTRQLPFETVGESFLPDIIGGTLMGNGGDLPNEASVPIINVQIQLWQDTDDNGIYRTNGDTLLETTLTDKSGRWRFTNIPDEEEHVIGIIIENYSILNAVNIIEGKTHTIGGVLYTNLGYARGINILSWKDTGGDGYYGNEGDMLVGITKSKKGGNWKLPLPEDTLNGVQLVNSWGVK